MTDRFSQAIEDHQRRLYGIAMKHLHNKDDAADALQETLLKAWRYFDTLADCEYLGAWLTRVLINECMNIMRKKKAYEQCVHRLGSRQALAYGYEDRLISRMDIGLALNELDEKKRRTFMLVALMGFTAQEAANATQQTKAAVTSQMNRSRFYVKNKIRVS